MVYWIPPVILFSWYDATSVHRKSLLCLSKIYYLIWTLGFLLCILHFSSIYLIKLCKIKISIKIHVHCFETFSVRFILTVTSKYLFWQQAPYIPSPATKKMKTPTTMIMIDRLLTTPTLKESRKLGPPQWPSLVPLPVNEKMFSSFMVKDKMRKIVKCFQNFYSV